MHYLCFSVRQLFSCPTPLLPSPPQSEEHSGELASLREEHSQLLVRLREREEALGRLRQETAFLSKQHTGTLHEVSQGHQLFLQSPKLSVSTCYLLCYFMAMWLVIWLATSTHYGMGRNHNGVQYNIAIFKLLFRPW